MHSCRQLLWTSVKIELFHSIFQMVQWKSRYGEEEIERERETFHLPWQTQNSSNAKFASLVVKHRVKFLSVCSWTFFSKVSSLNTCSPNYFLPFNYFKWEGGIRSTTKTRTWYFHILCVQCFKQDIKLICMLKHLSLQHQFVLAPMQDI